MANVRWIGNAQAVTQVDTITIANTWAAADTVTVTISGKTATFTAADGVIANICIGLAAAVNASKLGEFSELTATSTATTVVLTANTDGVPFTATVSKVAAGSGTAVLAHTTVATGPNFAQNAANWSTGSVPAAADAIFLDNSSVSILYDLDMSGIGTFASLNIAASYTGTVGLPKQNANGYFEYRADYLKIKATAIYVGTGDGQNSSRIKIDSSTVQTTMTVANTGSSSEASIQALLWKGTHASNSLVVENGNVGVASFGGETATLATLSVAGGTLFLGAGTTLTSCSPVITGGTVNINSTYVGMTLTGGTVTTNGTTASTGTNTVTGGTLNWSSTGTPTRIDVGNSSGKLDVSGNPAALTITTLNLLPGYSLTSKPSLTVGTLTMASTISSMSGQ